MRVRLRNKDAIRVGLTPEAKEIAAPVIIEQKEAQPKPKQSNNTLFYTTIGLLSVDIILQVVQIAMRFF